MFPLVKGGEIAEDQTLELDELYKRWERTILWKANNIEDKRHDAICSGNTNIREWCKCRTRQEEVHEWEDWIIDNYDQADELRNWNIPVQTLSRIAPPESKRSGKDYQESGDKDGSGVS